MNNLSLLSTGAFLFLVGLFELFLVTINFKFTQRNRKVCSGLSTILYVYIWAYIIFTLVENATNSFLLITLYALGCGLGDYLALYYDDVIDKKITRLQRRGRKKKRGKFYGKKK